MRTSLFALAPALALALLPARVGAAPPGGARPRVDRAGRTVVERKVGRRPPALRPAQLIRPLVRPAATRIGWELDAVHKTLDLAARTGGRPLLGAGPYGTPASVTFELSVKRDLANFIVWGQSSLTSREARDLVGGLRLGLAPWNETDGTHRAGDRVALHVTDPAGVARRVSGIVATALPATATTPQVVQVLVHDAGRFQVWQVGAKTWGHERVALSATVAAAAAP